MDVLVLVRGDYYFISVQFGVLSVDYLCEVCVGWLVVDLLFCWLFCVWIFNFSF